MGNNYTICETERLLELLEKNGWFQTGTSGQLIQFLKENKNGASLDDLASIIAICSYGIPKVEILNGISLEAQRYHARTIEDVRPKRKEKYDNSFLLQLTTLTSSISSLDTYQKLRYRRGTQLVGMTEFVIDRKLLPDTVLFHLIDILAHGSEWINKLFGLDACSDTTFYIREDEIVFPWFRNTLSVKEVKAYKKLLASFCNAAAKDTKKNLLYFSPYADGVEEPKGEMELLLLYLGFSTKEDSAEIRTLIRNFIKD